MTDAALIVLERSVQVCEHSMQVCERAEALAWEMLARTDRYGAGTADVVRWEELLDGSPTCMCVSARSRYAFLPRTGPSS